MSVDAHEGVRTYQEFSLFFYPLLKQVFLLLCYILQTSWTVNLC